MSELHPTVIIGLGSKGAEMVEGVQRRMYEMFKVNSLPIFQYVVVETNSKYQPTATPSGQDIEVVKLSSGGPGTFKNFEELLLQLENQDIHPDWIDRSFARRLIAQGEGAGGVRPVGRLILWANLGRVAAKIREARDRALRNSSIEKTQEILSQKTVGQTSFSIATTGSGGRKSANAIVCGTATGGTYSGAFIDMGYLCQHLLEIPEQSRDSLYSIMLLPPKQMGRQRSELHRFKANAYGSLLEQSYFTEPDVENERTYDTHLPGVDKRVTKSVPPYNYTYYVSQEYGEGSLKIDQPSGLAHLGGLKIFCDVMGLDSQRSARIVDHVGAGKKSALTFGMAAIMHPQFQISEYAACEAARRLCDRWTNTKTYTDAADQTYPVPSAAALDGQAQKFWEGDPNAEGLLKRQMGAVMAQDSDVDLLGEDVAADVRRLLDRNYKPVLRSFRDAGSTYYGRIKRNLPTVRESMIEAVNAFVMQRLEKTQNLSYASALARSLQRVIDDILEHWDALNIAEDNQAWSEHVSGSLYRRVRDISEKTITQVGNLLTTRESLLEGIILETVERLKAHLFRPILSEVKNALDETVQRLGRYKTFINRTRKVLENRKVAIREEINDESLPIGYLYANGDFSGEVDGVLERMAQPAPSAKHLSDGAFAPDTGSTWLGDTLDTWLRADESVTTGQSIRGVASSEAMKMKLMEQGLDVLRRDLTVDLESDVRTVHIQRFFGRGRQCHLRYKRADGRRVSIGDYLLGPSRALTGQVRQMVESELSVDVQSENNVILPGIDHMLLYYREEVIGSPLEVLEDIDAMKACFDEPPNESDMEEWVRDAWTDLRIAYAVPEYLEREQRESVKDRQQRVLTQLLEVIGAFLYTWDLQNGATWVPVDVADDVEDLDLSVGRPANGGAPRARWVIQLPNLPEIGYEVVNVDGSPVRETINTVTDDPPTAEKMIREGLDELRRIGREGLIKRWNAEVQSRVVDQDGASGAREAYRRYFGADEDQGLVGQLLEADH